MLAVSAGLREHTTQGCTHERSGRDAEQSISRDQGCARDPDLLRDGGSGPLRSSTVAAAPTLGVKGKHVRRDQARHKRASGVVGLVESGADVTIKTEVGEKASDGEVLVRGGVGDGRLRWGKGAAMDCL